MNAGTVKLKKKIKSLSSQTVIENGLFEEELLNDCQAFEQDQLPNNFTGDLKDDCCAPFDEAILISIADCEDCCTKDLDFTSAEPLNITNNSDVLNSVLTKFQSIKDNMK